MEVRPAGADGDGIRAGRRAVGHAAHARVRAGRGTVASGGSISITPVGGTSGGSAGYSCTPPPGITLPNASGTLSAGGVAVILAPTCPANNPDGVMTCTRTGGDVTPVSYTIDCPAAGVPVNAMPAPGALTCDAPPGDVASVSVTITGVGFGTTTGLTCALSGAGFVLSEAPTATLGAEQSTRATVLCTAPGNGQPPRLVTLSCFGVGAGPFAYLLSTAALGTGAPTHPARVPAGGPIAGGILAALILLALRRAGRVHD